MPGFRKSEYESVDKLKKLTLMMVQVLPDLNDAKSAKWDVLYSLNELDHVGGKCKRVTGTEKFHTHLDYNLIIHKPPFMDSGPLDRLRMLAHELYHIEKKSKSFLIRIHDGDFCEIAKHDSFSYSLAHQAAKELSIPV